MVLIADENRQPVDSVIVTRCFDHTTEKMPIGGIELTVVTPAEFLINVSALIITDGSRTAAAIQTDFITSLEDYFAEIALVSNQVIYSQVASRLSTVAGVVDYSNLTLNGGAGNIILTDEQVPVLGTVVLS